MKQSKILIAYSTDDASMAIKSTLLMTWFDSFDWYQAGRRDFTQLEAAFKLQIGFFRLLDHLWRRAQVEWGNADVLFYYLIRSIRDKSHHSSKIRADGDTWACG